jgi:UDP-glucose 4-epimerase
VLETLNKAIAGHDLIWHLAANTDIIGSHDRPQNDLEMGTIGTFNVLRLAAERAAEYR